MYQRDTMEASNTVASVQQKLGNGNRTGVLMHARQDAPVHEDSSHVAIPSVDSIILPQLLIYNNNILHLCSATERRNIPFVKMGGIQVLWRI